MLSALAQAALEGDLAAKVQALASDPKDGLAAALARLGRAFMARDLRVFPECSRCGETLPRVKSYWQQPVRTGRRKKGRRIEQEAAGRGCAAASIRSACATKPLDCRQNLHLAGISKIATGKSL